jgi:hypothetical protein
MLTASLHLSSVPKKKSQLSPPTSHLPPKNQSVISIAVDSASTHIYIPGIYTHVKAAIKAGATTAEIMEVIELTSTLGIHVCNIGVPLLVEVMKEQGICEGQKGVVEAKEEQERKRLREEFTKKRGYWHEFWEDFLALDPELLRAYLEFSTVRWVNDMKVMEVETGYWNLKSEKIRSCSFILKGAEY